MKTAVLTIFTIVFVLSSETNAKIKKKRNVVVTNNPYCTDIANQLIAKGGNAREVFIAVSLCEGMIHPMDSGLGGGFQAVYYSKSKGKRKALYINSREKSPSNPEFANYQIKGSNSIGVPSVLKGYETLYNLDKDKNKLKWNEIIAPVIELCDKGFQVTDRTRSVFNYFNPYRHYDQLIQINSDNVLKNPIYCNLLRQISEDGPSSSMYKENGKLHNMVMQDLRETSSYLTSKDIQNYKVKVQKPATGKFGKYTVYTTRVPGSGYTVLLALKMMERVKALMSKDATPAQKIVYLLKILKYTYAFQPHVRELRNATIHKIINKAGRILGSGVVKNGMEIRPTIPTKYGDVKLARMISPESFGTTNVVVKVGHTAISATSTINWSFGSGILSKTMGFFYNNQMNDFVNPNWRRKGKPIRNAPGPNKIPSSSISATIMVDPDGKPVFQIGAAGGSKILSAIVNTLYNYFVLNKTLEASLQECRFTPKLDYAKNHILYMYECIDDENVANQLREKGIDFQKVVESGYSAATALSQIRSKSEGVYDKRRGVPFSRN
ncbi:glutathione hydrolase 1 proenzyme-like isoform X2 [Chrysoperla carnea]|uniref:glutathione hydrolase 1 proenzyme-like isoform X2 n=1 Tax=Chrysoperla carnea TaxID=189513 RepID=UPI001D096F58|nr:glutathione hydrolase 1 proenzyme-like isoform X2 [Chrysoperla carnea]